MLGNKISKKCNFDSLYQQSWDPHSKNGIFDGLHKQTQNSFLIKLPKKNILMDYISD